MRPNKYFETYIFDLDGTVYLEDSLLPTALETIDHLQKLGKQILFLSNNPTRTRTTYAAKLVRLGIATSAEDVINSSWVMVDFLQQTMPGSRLFVVGENSLCEELTSARFELSDEPGRIDAVIASFDRTFDYRKLQIAFDAIRSGAHFFAINADRYCPVPGGGEPDAAAMIAAIEACTDVKVEAVVGKPSPYMAQAVLRLAQQPPENCIMTGDRLETDVLMGLSAGMARALVLTGATQEQDLQSTAIRPHFILKQLSDIIPN